MEYTFDCKKVIVTGAGKGIGRAIAKELARRKAHAIAISRTQEDLYSLKEEDSSVEVYCADISDWERTEQLLETIGPVDFLVNNAGVIMPSSIILEVTKEQLESAIDINFKAAFHISQLVARQMVSKNIEGSIVNMSSIAAKRGFNLYSAYCCSKAALDMLTMTLAIELGQYKIRANSVNPGLVLTDMLKAVSSDPAVCAEAASNVPIGRIAEVEDVVNAVIYLLSDKSSMITGTCIPVDGGRIVRYVKRRFHLNEKNPLQ